MELYVTERLLLSYLFFQHNFIHKIDSSLFYFLVCKILVAKYLLKSPLLP